MVKIPSFLVRHDNINCLIGRSLRLTEKWFNRGQWLLACGALAAVAVVPGPRDPQVKVNQT